MLLCAQVAALDAALREAQAERREARERAAAIGQRLGSLRASEEAARLDAHVIFRPCRSALHERTSLACLLARGVSEKAARLDAHVVFQACRSFRTDCITCMPLCSKACMVRSISNRKLGHACVVDCRKPTVPGLKEGSS